MFGRTATALKDDIVNIDDAVQAFLRQKLWGLEDKGTRNIDVKQGPVNSFTDLMGNVLHRVPSTSERTDFYKNPEGGDSWSNNVGIGLSRALQAGVVTGAGATLVNLTKAIGEQFGGSADRPSPSELPPQ